MDTKRGPPSCFLRQKSYISTNKPTEPDFYIGNDINFGNNGKKVSIGCSRPKVKPPEQTPGPGQYETPVEPFKTRFYHRISESHLESRKPTTNDIDFIDATVFPEEKPISIGKIDNQKFFTVNDTPPCSFVEYRTFEKPRIRIGKKISCNQIDKIPGPGEYTPKDVVHFRMPSYTLSGPKYRDEWLYQEKENTPSPGEYNLPIVPLYSPHITIGSRSRTRNGTRNKNLIAVDTFICDLGDAVTIEEAREYIETHKSLERIVRFVFNRVLKEKPEKPIQFLKTTFEKISSDNASKSFRGSFTSLLKYTL